jgi:pyrroline-5-carboxylate reductase
MKEEHNLTESSTANKFARLAFIGAGNMASCIIGGLVKNNYPAANIIASDPSADTLNKLQKQFGIATSDTNINACQWAQIVVLATKPQLMKTVAAEIKPGLAHKPLIISIAAGINSRQLQQWLGNEIAVIRTMPNTPALVQKGATGLYATAAVSKQQCTQAEVILNAIGYTAWVQDEPLIDAVTAVSGSGPAYFFLLMEAMINAGVKQGLTRATAEQLTVQTALGAAELVKASDTDVAELRRRVTSPGGTTEQAILHFQEAGFAEAVAGAMDACAERSRQLAEEFN